MEIRNSRVITKHEVITGWKEGKNQAVLLFSKLNKIFFRYFDPENIFLDNENNYFSG